MSGDETPGTAASNARATRIALITFLALGFAAFAAFFVAQRLKNSPTVVQGFRARGHFSPNGDGRADVERISFTIKNDDQVTVEVVDEKGDVVRTLARDRSVRRYNRIPTLVWDGRDDHRAPARDGVYRIRITLRDQGRTITVPRSFVLDTTAPRPEVVRVRPAPPVRGPAIVPRPDGKPVTARLRLRGTQPEVTLFRMSPGPVTAVLHVRLADRTTTWSWDGMLNGRPARPGTYVVGVQTEDQAGNIGRSPALTAAGVPRQTYGAPFPGRGGITVRSLAIQPPSVPVLPGRRATFGVDARGRPYRWTLHRLGGRTLRTGTSSRPILSVTARDKRAGLDLLGVRSGVHRAASPLAMQSSTHRPVLVILPWVTWQGRNPVDDDGDGRPNTLDAGLPVRLNRVFAGDGLPVGLVAQVAPLLKALDAAGRRYDLTTDAALNANQGPKLAGRTGVLIAGDAHWLPTTLARRLAQAVRSGTNVASFSPAALQRFVTVNGDTATAPTQPTTTDLFGARPAAVIAAPVTLTSDKDTLGLFTGTAGQFGPFTGVVPYVAAATGGPVLASAVTPQGAPVVLATRVGRGIAVRFPIPGFAARLSTDPELDRLLQNTWTLLSR